MGVGVRALCVRMNVVCVYVRCAWVWFYRLHYNIMKSIPSPI